MESLWDQWWAKTALWIIGFALISQYSPWPMLPTLYLIGTIVWVIISAMFFNRNKSNPTRYYRGA